MAFLSTLMPQTLQFPTRTMLAPRTLNVVSTFWIKDSVEAAGQHSAPGSEMDLSWDRAFGCAEALSDRLCIATNGSVNIDLSPQILVSCDWEGRRLPPIIFTFFPLTFLPLPKLFPFLHL